MGGRGRRREVPVGGRGRRREVPVGGRGRRWEVPVGGRGRRWEVPVGGRGRRWEVPVGGRGRRRGSGPVGGRGRRLAVASHNERTDGVRGHHEHPTGINPVVVNQRSTVGLPPPEIEPFNFSIEPPVAEVPLCYHR